MLGRATILLSFFFLFALPAKAIYDPLSVLNNKFGIHILDTSEVERAAELVNSSGGSWGYVTIPIRANDRNLPKWTKFMEEAQRLHIIPILRIASFPVDPPGGEASHWMAPNEYDLVDFANFLDELPWPIKNRYVVVYNEPNHEGEWGGFVYPQEYARVLDRAIDIFHQRGPDFFVISAGMDASSDPYSYYQRMLAAWPGVLNKADGLAFHAYGNPAFSAYPNIYSPVNVTSYRYELDFLRRLGVTEKPIFITEAGWKNGGWLKFAFENVWREDKLIAVTPFLLDARTEPFVSFSFLDANGNFKSFAREVMVIPKTQGQPQIAPGKVREDAKISSWTGNSPQMSRPGLIVSWLHRLLGILTGRE